jgi:hypothetical protein
MSTTTPTQRRHHPSQSPAARRQAAIDRAVSLRDEVDRIAAERTAETTARLLAGQLAAGLAGHRRDLDRGKPVVVVDSPAGAGRLTMVAENGSSAWVDGCRVAWYEAADGVVFDPWGIAAGQRGVIGAAEAEMVANALASQEDR